MRVMNHSWSAMKQRLHPQSVAEISCHSVLSGTGFDNVGHRLGLATRTQITVCKSPFPSAGTAVSLLSELSLKTYELRQRVHNFQLPTPSSSLLDSNYFMRMLFKNIGCVLPTGSILWCFITALGMLYYIPSYRHYLAAFCLLFYIILMNEWRLLKMVPFESFGMVSYLNSMATMAISLAVSTQYTNVTETQPLHDSKNCLYRCAPL